MYTLRYRMQRYKPSMLRIRWKWFLRRMKKTNIGRKIHPKYVHYRIKYLPDWQRKVFNPLRDMYNGYKYEE